MSLPPRAMPVDTWPLAQRPRARKGARLLYWSEHTAGLAFDTGIQRVVRNLGRGLARLGVDVDPVGWDGLRRHARTLSAPERERLGLPIAPAFVAAGSWRGTWMLLPEIPATILGDGCDPIRLARAYGAQTAALVHDAIPLRHPDLYDAVWTEFYARYFEAVANVDLAIATTEHVARDLRRILPARYRACPPVVVCPLAAELPGIARVRTRQVSRAPGSELNLLTVSRWEPRKNLPRLLRAVAAARARGRIAPIGLTIVGRRGGFAAYEAEVLELLANMPWARVADEADDGEMVALYRSHHVSVYPSWDEGYGLPVLESLWLARPCLCHAGSAMAEVAPGGGTMLVDMLDEAAITEAICRLAAEPGLVDRLSAEAVARPLRRWSETATAFAACLGMEPDGIAPGPIGYDRRTAVPS